jgi:antitoxin VapB
LKRVRNFRVSANERIDMPLNIKDPETERLARELAAHTEKSITDAVKFALRDSLKRQGARTEISLKDEIMEISRRCAALPRRTGKTADEICWP